ncbi:hypothetical protein AKO1_015269 [Acrasis kona]|uniref:Uncharacterized protein n=1 Tax=Acrasis kona TaxID=1008807 RepID=A0AAW2ZH31_9EUKA
MTDSHGRIGYAHSNKQNKLSTNHSFRLASFGVPKMKEYVSKNIDHFKQILKYNKQKGIKIFRIGSDFIPFASHESMTKLIPKWDWRKYFAVQLKHIGQNLIKDQGFRVSMHPDHYCLVNSNDVQVVKKSLDELNYHIDLFEAMNLDASHKIIINLGGVYKDKSASMDRFINQYKSFPDRFKKHVVIENDDHLYSLDDCMYINEKCGVPVSLNTFHHECYNTNGDTLRQAFLRSSYTWNLNIDGSPIVSYSSQNDQEDTRRGANSETLDVEHFKKTICEWLMRAEDCHGYVLFDLIIETRDREMSALLGYTLMSDYHKQNRIDGAVKEFSQEELEEESQHVVEQAILSEREVTSGLKIKLTTPSKKRTCSGKILEKSPTTKRIKLDCMDPE